MVLITVQKTAYAVFMPQNTEQTIFNTIIYSINLKHSTFTVDLTKFQRNLTQF